jgi:hypothetical protein
MRSFRATLSEAIPAQLLFAFAKHWKRLRCLLLHRFIAELTVHSWSGEHDAAILNLVRKLPRLTHVVCVNGNMKPNELANFNVGDTSVNLRTPTAGLRLLWVTALKGVTVNAIFRQCPALSQINQMPGMLYLPEKFIVLVAPVCDSRLFAPYARAIQGCEWGRTYLS